MFSDDFDDCEVRVIEMYSFFEQIFIECLLCARQSSRRGMQQEGKLPDIAEFLMGGD